MTNNPATTKTCNKCSKDFPATLEYWHRDSTRRDTLCIICKECATAYHRNWRNQNGRSLPVKKGMKPTVEVSPQEVIVRTIYMQLYHGHRRDISTPLSTLNPEGLKTLVQAGHVTIEDENVALTPAGIKAWAVMNAVLLSAPYYRHTTEWRELRELARQETKKGQS